MKYKLLLLLVVLEIAVATLVFFRFGNVAYNGDALYESQVARNILAGKGYVTSEMPLYAVDLYHKKGIALNGPWINTHKFALPAYIKAVFIKFFGDSLASVTFLYSYAFHFLTLLAIYLFGLRIWPQRPGYAFLAAFIFLANPILGFGTPYIMMSGLTLGIDSFLFLSLLYVMHRWRQSGNRWLLASAGILSGVAFLVRYNVGLYIVAVFCALAYLIVFKRRSVPMRSAVKRFLIEYGVYFTGFAAVITVFVIWHLRATGFAFLSINGLFQLLFDTKFNSFIDPWYKLEYIFPTDDPLSFAVAHPVPLVVKWLKYAALDALRLVSFENVTWWTFLVAVYFLLPSRKKSIETVFAFMVALIGVLAFLQLLLLPLWAGSVVYFFYLFPPFSLIIAYVLCELYDRWRQFLPRISNSVRDVFRSLASLSVPVLVRNLAIAILVVAAIVFVVYSSASLVLQPLAIRGYLVAIFAVAVMAGVVVVAYTAPRFLPAVLLILVSAYFIAQTGIITAPTEAEILRSRWDLESDPAVIDILKKFDRGGVSLSATPWNTVWWSGNALLSLPLPEYPDEIYLLEHLYGQRIDSIYLNKLALYPFKYIAYPWTAYQRVVRYGYDFDGFEAARRTEDGLILSGITLTASTTSLIDFGKHSANSHLIWGWGENRLEFGRDYVSAGPYRYLSQQKDIVQGTRSDEKKISREQTVEAPFILVNDRERVRYMKPDAEVTFLTNEARKPSRAEIVVRPATEGIVMDIVMNGNLLYRDQPGSGLGSYNLRNGWQTIVVDLAKPNAGINKLSFVFSGDPIGEQPRWADFDLIKLVY